MKRLFYVILSLCLACLSLAKDVKILTIGNSFSASAFVYLPKIVETFSEHTLILESANHPGCSFERHWNYITAEEKDSTVSKYNKEKITQSFCKEKSTSKSESRGCNRLSDILKSKKWDIITIHQQSAKSSQRETFYPYADNICDYIKKYASNAEIVIHQTWSYRCDEPRIAKGGTWGIDQTKMFRLIESCYDELAQKKNLRILPMGRAVQNYRLAEKKPFKPFSKEYLKSFKYPKLPSNKGDVIGSYFWRKNKAGTQILCTDYTHLNNEGEYLQACLWFGFFYDEDPINIKYVPKKIDVSDAKLMREIASKTLKEFKQPRDKNK